MESKAGFLFRTIIYNFNNHLHLAVLLSSNNCCIIKKFAHGKWKIRMFSDIMTFKIKNFKILTKTLTPYLNDRKLKIEDSMQLDNKKLRKIIWVEDDCEPFPNLICTCSEIAKIINKKSKDVSGKYDHVTKLYNQLYGKSLISLGKPLTECKVLILDTSKMFTCTELIKIGFLPSNIYVPNYTFEEYKILNDSKLCSASYEDFSVCLARLVISGIKFNSIFLDNGGWINTAPNESKEKRNSQDSIIKYIFEKNALLDECVFGMTTSVRRYTKEQNDTYLKDTYLFMEELVKSYDYKIIKSEFMEYGKRNFFQYYHLLKATTI